MDLCRIVLFFFLFNSVLFGKFIDNDFDGVDDRIDRCLDSKITDIVDKYGCKIDSLESSKISFTILFSLNYDEDVVSKDLFFEVAFKNYYISFKKSDFVRDIDKDKRDDDSIRAGVVFNIKKLLIDLSVGVDIPSIKDQFDRNDYFIELNYIYPISKFELVGYIRYNITHDLLVKNSFEGGFGGGVNFENSSFSILLNYQEDELNSNNSSFSLEVGGNYYINSHLFLAFGIEKSLKDDSNSYTFSIGYSF